MRIPNVFPNSIWDVAPKAQLYNPAEMLYVMSLGYVVPDTDTAFTVSSNNSSWLQGRYGSLSGSRYVESGKTWTKIHGGGTSMFGIATDGTLWSWGTVSTPLGRTVDTANPANAIRQVGSATDWATISTSANYAIGLKTDGTLWSWGSNATGLTAQGTTSGTTATPTQVGSSTYSLIGTGIGAAYALGTDGNLYTWGNNTINGLNTAGTSTTPQLVVASGALGTTISAIGQNMQNCFMIIVDGKLYVAGSNIGYGTGLGTNSGTTSTFTQVGANADWLDANSGGGPMFMGRRSDTSVRCQGFGTPYTIQGALTWTVPVTPNLISSTGGVRQVFTVFSGTSNCGLVIIDTSNRIWLGGSNSIANFPTAANNIQNNGVHPISNVRAAYNDTCIIFYQ
jgi:hypothetical protein